MPLSSCCLLLQITLCPISPPSITSTSQRLHTAGGTFKVVNFDAYKLPGVPVDLPCDVYCIRVPIPNTPPCIMPYAALLRLTKDSGRLHRSAI